MNSINITMEAAGWNAEDSGGGCEWYLKKVVLPDGRPGYMAITDVGGASLPTYWGQEVFIGYYDRDMNSYRDGELDRQDKLSNVNLIYTRGDNV